MNLEKLDQILKNEPKYRLRQARQVVFVDFIENWGEATTLSKALREELNKECPLDIKAEISESQDQQTKKILITLADGAKVETVLMDHKVGRQTACISTQVGCALGCSFCATGKMGFNRDLTVFEIVEQVLVWNRYFKKNKIDKTIDNVVLMGMGEPFLNYDNVMAAIRILNSKDGLGIGARKISISTSGIVPGIVKLAEENLQVNLAISLHAPNNGLRTKLMPINITYSLDKIFKAVDEYTKKTNRKVMFEYLMIDGVNDDQTHARELANLFRARQLYIINLISYNPTGRYRPSSPDQIKKFQSILEHKHIKVTLRHGFGHDIQAACGQLAS